MDDEHRELERLIDFWTPFAVRMLGEAGVFAAFGTGTRPIDDVAGGCGLDAGALRRFVRVLAARGVFEDAGDDAFRLTPLGLRLVPGRPGSVAGLVNFKPQELHAWAEAPHALRTGEPAFPHHYGMPMFAWLAEHPAALTQFNETMSRRTDRMLDGALAAIDWPEAGVVVDVGGGNGLLLERLLQHRPGLTGVLFDLPAVVGEAPARLAAAGLAGRVELRTGSFFDAIPAGGDLYVLSNILHDWDDANAAAILERLHAVAGPHVRIRIFDAVLPEDGSFDLGLVMDLHMLVLLGGAERTRGGWSTLLGRAGFVVERIVPTPTLAWVEGRADAAAGA